MRSLRYLNTMLTLIAVLLTLHLWTLWTTGPASDRLVEEAHAQGIVDAGAQRKMIVDELKLLNQKTDQLLNLFKTGGARIKVEAAPKE